jgi:hypothetical protein
MQSNPFPWTTLIVTCGTVAGLGIFAAVLLDSDQEYRADMIRAGAEYVHLLRQ